MVGYPCRDTKNKKIIILHHQALEPSVRLLHLEFIRSLQLIMHLQSISKVKNQMSLTGDQTALMIMGNLILLTVGQNWPGRWKIQPYWQGWVPMDLFTLEARMKCTCPWLSWDPQCTMASILLLAAQSLEHFFSQWFATCGCSDKFVVADVNKSLSKEGGRYFSTRSFLLPPLFLGCTVH